MKTMIAIKVTKSYFTIFLDIETAFLHGDLEEELYMMTPEGLSEFLDENLDGQCVVLHKSIYGLVHSARQYWKKLRKHLKEMGFKICANDNCLLKRESKDGTVFICLYVNDLMCTGDKEAVMKAVKRKATANLLV